MSVWNDITVKSKLLGEQDLDQLRRNKFYVAKWCCRSRLCERVDFAQQGYQKMLDRLSFKREKIVDIQKALKSADVNQDNKLDFEEWRANLKS